MVRGFLTSISRSQTTLSCVAALSVGSLQLHLSFYTHCSIDVVAHPVIKFKYFEKAKWPKEWIDTARTIIHDLWQKHYKPMDPAPSTTQVRILSVHLSLMVMTSHQPPSCSDSLFTLNDISAPTSDALEDYMASPTIPTDDPIVYWQSFLGTPATAPLAQMCLDILSDPGMFLFCLVIMPQYINSMHISVVDRP